MTTTNSRVQQDYPLFNDVTVNELSFRKQSLLSRGWDVHENLTGNLNLDFLYGGTVVISFMEQGGFTISGPLIITDTTQSTSKDTGSIVTEGGVGIELNLNVGGTLGVNTITSLSANTNLSLSGNGTGIVAVTDSLEVDSISSLTNNTNLSLSGKGTGVVAVTDNISVLAAAGSTTILLGNRFFRAASYIHCAVDGGGAALVQTQTSLYDGIAVPDVTATVTQPGAVDGTYALTLTNNEATAPVTFAVVLLVGSSAIPAIMGATATPLFGTAAAAGGTFVITYSAFDNAGMLADLDHRVAVIALASGA